MYKEYQNVSSYYLERIHMIIIITRNLGIQWGRSLTYERKTHIRLLCTTTETIYTIISVYTNHQLEHPINGVTNIRFYILWSLRFTRTGWPSQWGRFSTMRVPFLWSPCTMPMILCWYQRWTWANQAHPLFICRYNTSLHVFCKAIRFHGPMWRLWTYNSWLPHFNHRAIPMPVEGAVRYGVKSAGKDPTQNINCVTFVLKSACR